MITVKFGIHDNVDTDATVFKRVLSAAREQIKREAKLNVFVSPLDNRALQFIDSCELNMKGKRL